jgi:hypothetical protein
MRTGGKMAENYFLIEKNRPVWLALKIRRVSKLLRYKGLRLNSSGPGKKISGCIVWLKRKIFIDIYPRR